MEYGAGELMRGVVKRVLVIIFLAVLTTFAIGKFSSAMLLGLVFGGTVAVLNFRLMAISIAKAVEMSPGKAQIYASTRYFVRMAIAGAVLFVSIKAPYISIVGTVIGLLSVKLAVIQMGISGKDMTR